MVEHPDFIFSHLPKTAGSFVDILLVDTIEEATSTARRHVRITTLKDWNKKYKFGVIRNPFDWYISWWKYSPTTPEILNDYIFDNGRDENFLKYIKFILSDRVNKMGCLLWTNY